MELLAGVVLLVLLNLACVVWGADSRDRDARTWPFHARAGRRPGVVKRIAA